MLRGLAPGNQDSESPAPKLLEIEVLLRKLSGVEPILNHATLPHPASATAGRSPAAVSNPATTRYAASATASDDKNG